MTFDDILKQVSTLAVVGYSNQPEKPAHYVPAYLAEQGYRILPVNPNRPGAGRLSELQEPVDLVLLFRPSQDVPAHQADILSLQPLPRVVWMQSGIRNHEVAAQLQARGIEVVQDRCMLVEHQRWRSQS